MVAGSAPIATATSMRLVVAGGTQAAIMLGALFVGLPVHAGGALVVNLHAVQPQLRLPVSGLRENTIGSVMKRPPSCGQHFRIGKFVQRKIVAADHFLARPVGHDLRKERAHLGQLRQHLQFADEPFGHAHFQKLGDARGDFIDRGHFERDLHPPHAGERVDQHRNARALGLFEQQRGAAVLHAAVGELGDLELGIDFERDALQLVVLFERAHEVAQIGVGHNMSLL